MTCVLLHSTPYCGLLQPPSAFSLLQRSFRPWSFGLMKYKSVDSMTWFILILEVFCKVSASGLQAFPLLLSGLVLPCLLGWVCREEGVLRISMESAAGDPCFNYKACQQSNKRTSGKWVSSGLDIETSTHRCTNVARPHPWNSWSLMSSGTLTTHIFHRVGRWMLDVRGLSVFGVWHILALSFRSYAAGCRCCDRCQWSWCSWRSGSRSRLNLRSSGTRHTVTKETQRHGWLTVQLSVESGQEKTIDKAEIMSKKKINMQCNEIVVALCKKCRNATQSKLSIVSACLNRQACCFVVVELKIHSSFIFTCPGCQ